MRQPRRPRWVLASSRRNARSRHHARTSPSQMVVASRRSWIISAIHRPRSPDRFSVLPALRFLVSAPLFRCLSRFHELESRSQVLGISNFCSKLEVVNGFRRPSTFDLRIVARTKVGGLGKHQVRNALAKSCLIASHCGSFTTVDLEQKTGFLTP